MQKKSPTQTKAGVRAVTTAAPTTPTVTMTATVQPMKTAPSREEIAQRAYEIYVARGQAGGRELEDWVQAEQELFERTHRNN